jgi:outer membrane protein assembly factor BamB
MFHRPFLTFALLLLTSAFFAAPSRAADPVKPDDHDWPQWRGPNRDGVAADTGLLKKWPEGGPPFLYAFKGMAQGYCPPSIVGDKAYITGRFDKNDAYLMAFELPPYDALKPAAPGDMPILGKMLWKTKYGSSCQSGENAAPVVVGNQIFITSGDGDVAGVGTDGKLLWTHNMQKDFKAHVQTNSTYGFSESPLVDGDKVIVCPGTRDAVMVAYDKNTGALLWKTENPNGGNRDSASHASTMISNAAGVKHYVNLTGWGLVGVSPEGKYLWGYKKTCESSIPTPIIKDDYVFAISSYGFGSILIKLTKEGETGLMPNVVYQLNSEESECLCGQAVLIGDKVYVGHGKYAGTPQCIDFLTGKLEWRAPRQEGTGVAALIAYDGMLIFRNESKELVLVEANPKEYNYITKFKPISQKRGYAPLVVAHGLLYARDDNVVMVYDLHQK